MRGPVTALARGGQALRSSNLPLAVPTLRRVATGQSAERSGALQGVELRTRNSKLETFTGLMNTAPLELALAELFQWCRQHNFSGHDPFDALNSRLFQATPLKQSRKARFFWTQVLKRSPLNLRKLALIPAEKNSKGIALFSLAALANHRRLKTKESEREARELLNELLALRLQGHSGAAWGYNFDWQSRVFFAPRGTPTIVPTAFAARALLEAAQLFSDEGYLSVARSTCDFILQDLPRSVETAREVCFGYTPSSETRIYNASLLAAEVLAGVGALSGESELCEVSLKAARYVVNQQRSDGSWTYGVEPTQPWVDNFHTAFLLGSLKRITEIARWRETTTAAGHCDVVMSIGGKASFLRMDVRNTTMTRFIQLIRMRLLLQSLRS